MHDAGHCYRNTADKRAVQKSEQAQCPEVASGIAGTHAACNNQILLQVLHGVSKTLNRQQAGMYGM